VLGRRGHERIAGPAWTKRNRATPPRETPRRLNFQLICEGGEPRGTFRAAFPRSPAPRSVGLRRAIGQQFGRKQGSFPQGQQRPSLPLRLRDPRFSFAVLGPVDSPPWDRQRRLPVSTLTAHGFPCRFLAPHIGRVLRGKSEPSPASPSASIARHAKPAAARRAPR
jgi:hypothetical protein